MDFITSKIPRFYRVCKCADLKSGNKIIAYVLIAMQVISTFSAIYTILQTKVKLDIELDNTEEGLKEMQQEFNRLNDLLGIKNGNNSKELLAQVEKLKELQEDLDFFLAAYALGTIIIGFIMISIYYLFIKGIKEGNTTYMMPYLTLFAIPTAFFLTFAIAVWILVFFYIAEFFKILLFSILSGIVTLIVGYIYACAYSLYKETEDEKVQKIGSEAGASAGYNL